jgi:hypothetical protein
MFKTRQARREQARREAALLETCLRQQQELADQFGTQPNRIPELRGVRL